MKSPTTLSRISNPHLVQIVVDVLVIGLGWSTGLIFANITEEFKRSDQRSLVMMVVATIVTLLVLERRGLYAGRPALPRTDEISRVFVATLAGASAITVWAAFLDWHIGAREILLGWFVVFGARTLARGVVRTLASEFPNGASPEKVVIVGTGFEARELADLIIDHPESQFTLAGVVGNLGVAERSGLVDHWIGPTGRLIELMHQHGADGAIVTTTGFRGEQFKALTRALFQSGYDVHLTTGVSRLGQGRFGIRSLSHEPLVVMERNPVHRSHLGLKRLSDIVMASIVLLLASPVMLTTAFLIWISDRGPVFYNASRVGRRGELFSMYKFRSMVTNADALKAQMAEANERTGPLFKISDDPRITRIGKIIRETSIDELPQLFNVLKGDMSLVGPRPALPEEGEAFDEELRDRFVVRPGITGLWQVEARSNAAFNAYRRLDLHYVENWTLTLDFRILLATAEQVVVTLALLPLRALRLGSRADGITGTDVAEAGAAANRRTTAEAAVSNGGAVNGADHHGDDLIDLRRGRPRSAAVLDPDPLLEATPSSGYER